MYKTLQFHPKDLDLKQFTFLVTGGAGFIGSHITEYLLEHGAGKVIVLDNLCEGSKQNLEHLLGFEGLEFVEGDICDLPLLQNLMQGVDYVLHQAALGSVPRSIKNPILTNNSNVTGFLNVLESAKNAGVKSFVYASSSSVYGDHQSLPKIESQIGNALSPYAVSKRVNELYAEVFWKSYNFQTIGLRYFNVFGPRQKPDGPYAAVIPLFIQSLVDNIPAYINGDGLQTRDFTFVENAVQANIRALFTTNPESFGKFFNVAVGERVSVLEMYNLLRSFYGSELNPIHRDEREGDIRDSLANIEMARNLLGYNPTVKMEEGLKLTLKWFTSKFVK